MTQVATEMPGAGADAQLEAAQVETPTAATQTTTSQDDAYVRVPKEQLGPWGGRWTDVMAEANRFRSAHRAGVYEPGVDRLIEQIKGSGLTVQKFLEMYEAEGAEEPPQGEVPSQAGAPAGVTKDEVRMLMRDEFRSMTNSERLERAKADEARSVHEALVSAGWKFDEDGRPADKRAWAARELLYAEALQGARKSVPNYLEGDDRAKAEQEAMGRPLTRRQIAEASESLKALFSDWSNAAVSDFAKGQQRIPGSSLGGGAGGGAPPKRFDEMSYEQQAQSVEAALRARGIDPEGRPPG